MSRIYFHSEHGEAEVRGRERAHGRQLADEMLALSLGLYEEFPSPESQHPITRLLPDYLKRERGKGQLDAIGRFLRVGGMMGNDKINLPNGDTTDPFILSLNTAWVMGSNPVRLLVRLHGQCEIHCFVEGPNRNWLADIIKDGRKSGIMHADCGWESVAELLQSRDDCPVVTSYSVCEQFPNAHVAGWKPSRVDEYGEPAWDDWYKLDTSDRWRLVVAGLRTNGAAGLEMKPDNWNAFFFGQGETGFSLMRSDAATDAEPGGTP